MSDENDDIESAVARANEIANRFGSDPSVSGEPKGSGMFSGMGAMGGGMMTPGFLSAPKVPDSVLVTAPAPEAAAEEPADDDFSKEIMDRQKEVENIVSKHDPNAARGAEKTEFPTIDAAKNWALESIEKGAQAISFGNEKPEPDAFTSQLHQLSPSKVTPDIKAEAAKVMDPVQLKQWPAWLPKTEAQHRAEFEQKHAETSMTEKGKEAWNVGVNIGKGLLDVGARFGSGVAKAGATFLSGPGAYGSITDPKEWQRYGTSLAKLATVPAVSVAESLESVVQTASNAFQNGLSATDWVNEQLPVEQGGITHEEAFQNYLGRKRADEYYAGWKATDPNVFTRVIMEDPATRELAENMAYSMTSIWSPSVDDRLQRHNGNRDAAMREKQLDDLRDSQQLISNFRQEAAQMVPDPDMTEAAGWTRFGMNPFDIYGRIGSVGMRGISKGLKAASRVGKTAEQIAAMEAEAAAKAFEAELKAAEAAKTPGWVEGFAGKVADKVEPAAAWLSARYSDLPESVQEGLAKMGSGMIGTPLTKTAAILANAGVAAPRIAQAALAGRRLAAGGVEGGFEAGAKAATEAAAKTGLSPKAQQWLANKSIPAAKTLDWMAQNSMEMARGSVHGATLAAAVGVLENKDIEEIADMMGQGIFLHLGGEVMGNMTGVSHGRYMGNLKRQRASAAKWFSELDPATQAHVRDLGNWDSYVESLKGLRDNAENNYAQRKGEADNIVYSGESPEKIQAAQEKANDALNELNIRNAQVKNAEKANSDTQKMYRDSLNIGMADVMTALNGSSKAGRNVEMRFTTAEELAREALTNNRDKGLTDLEMIELYNFVLGQSAEFAFIAENGGKHTLTSGKTVDLYTPYKDRININIDSIKARMGSGESALNAFGHEAGHAFWNVKEFREGVADTYKELFGNQKFDERGNLIGGDPGLFSMEDLINKFKDSYARGYDLVDQGQLASMTPEQRKEETAKQLAQKIGLWDSVMQQLDPQKTAAYMRHEMMAELIQGGAQGGIKLGADPKPWLAPLVDWATTKQKNTKTGKKVRSAFGLTESAPWDSDLTGTRFSAEQVESTRNALRAVAELNGDIAAAEIIPHAPITETQMRSNEAVANQFGEAFFAHEKVATVLDRDGNVLESRVITDPAAMEGTFEHGVTETGEPELRQTAGYGSLPTETHNMSVPEGGRVTVTSRIKRDASGSLAALTPDQAKALNKARANIIRKAILDAPDREYPGRMDTVSADGLSLGGRLSPKQIEAIKGLPETIIPFGLKRRILEFNDLLVRDDGDAMIGLYGQAMDRQGRYKSFAPKIVDFVPLGMRLSKDGNILFNMFSKTGMREKLRRWQRDTPELLTLWNGDGESFMGDVRKVLENWKPREGAPAGLPGETGLDADLNIAISKKNRINDFLNIFRKTEPESLTANPARTTMRRPARRLTKAEKLDEESSDPNTLIRSYRVDRFHDLEKSSDAPFRVNYGKALYNLMPAKSEAEQRPELPPIFEPSILKGLRSINAFYMGSGAGSRLPLTSPVESFTTRFKPRQNEEDAMVSHGFYSKAGAVLLDKMPNRASAAQLRGILDPQKGSGVKPEELKWSGIDQFIERTAAENGFVTKDDLRKWLKEDYAAQFKTKVLRESRPMSKEFEFYSDAQEWGDTAKFKTIEEAVEAAQSAFGLTRKEAEVFVWDTNEAHSAYTQDETEYRNLNLHLPGGQNYKETILQMPGLGFKSPKHFQGAPDYVAHMRTAEHGSGLLVDELQSDLHQLGREKGYKEPVPLEEFLPELEKELEREKIRRGKIVERQKEVKKDLRSMPADARLMSPNELEYLLVLQGSERDFYKNLEKVNESIDRLDEEIKDYKSGKKVKTRGAIPDAPFKKDWPLQLFKYALKDAVESGKEWVGWTGGEAQAKRYNQQLQSKVDAIQYSDNENGTYAVYGVKNGENVFWQDKIPKDKIASFVGQDIADKMAKNEGKDVILGDNFPFKSIEGENLTIGNRGMTGFYDVMLPKELGKYVKQWGGKVEESSIGEKGKYRVFDEAGEMDVKFDTEQEAKAFRERFSEISGVAARIERQKDSSAKIWKVAITPEMRESVAGGQTRFSPAKEEHQNELDKFSDKWKQSGVRVSPTISSNGNIRPNVIVVPKQSRKQGIGTSVMEELVEIADKQGRRISISPSTDFGGSSVNRLKDFYSRFGFIENKGKNKDFTIRETMYREPSLKPSSEQFSTGAGQTRFMPSVAVVPERFTGTGEEEGRRGRYVEPPKSFKRFDISQYEPGGKFFDSETGEDLTNKTYENASIGVAGGKPTLVANNESESTGTGPLFRTNLFKQKAGWKWVSEGAPDTSTIVSVEGQGKHLYALQADFQNGVKMARYEDKASEPRLRPTGRGELTMGEQIGTIDIRGKEHPVYDRVTIGAAPESVTRFSPAKLDAEYNAAFEAKDEKKAQMLVDEFARRAGYSTEKFYHGTPTGGFNEFDPELKGTMGGRARGGFSFTTNQDVAKAYSEGFTDNDVALTKAVTLINKAFRKFDSSPDALKIIGEHTEGNPEIDVAPEYGAEHFEESPRQIRDWFLSEAAYYKDKLPELSKAHIEAAKALKSESASPEVKPVYLMLPEGTKEIDSTRESLAQDVWGLDVKTKPNGAFIVNLEEGDRIAYVADPRAIKSADPFTYDNNGNLIPLSERFNPSTGDIRFMPAKKGAPGALEGIKMEPKEEERRFFFTTSTERDAAIAELVAGEAEKDIERLNQNSILHAMTGIKDIDISIENSRGVYKGDKEVSAITTVKAKRGADMDAVRSRFMDLAKVFKQMEVLEEKVGAGKEEMLGQVDDKGFKHIHSAVVEIGKMKPEMIEQARKKAGIDGMTMADGRVELLNRGDDNEFIQRAAAFKEAINELGGDVRGFEKGISSVRSYSENPQEYPGTVGYDDPSLHLQTERFAGGAEYGRLNTPLARKLAQLGAFAAPAEGKRNFFEAKDVTKEQAKFQAEVAKVFDKLPDNDMQSGLTQEAYAALAKEIKEQYVILTSGPDGLKFTSKLYSEGGEPYKNSDAAIRDIRENNRLDFLKTDADAFGPPGADFSGHPLLKDSGLKDANGVPLLYNDLFRAVHDTIAHGMFGSSFGPVGEEGAFHVHVRTIQNPLARWAMLTETRGQNSWVNYRPEMLKKNGMPLQKGDAGYIPLQERGFAVQKAALLPLEYALTGDKEVDKPIMDLMKTLGTYARGSRPATKQELAIEARVKKGVIAEQKEASEFVKGANGIITDSIFVDGNNKLKTSVEDTPPYYLMSLGVRPLPNIEMVKEKGQKDGTPKDLLKLAQSPEKYDTFAKRLIASADALSADPGRFVSPKGYSEFMRWNGITGTVLSPPSMLKMLIETPQQYLDLLTGGFHEEKTVKGGWEAANGGLNGVMEMRALCGPEGPPPMVTALHHLWGTLSKQLPPLDQEACWLRLISDKRVLEAIQSSIDGTFDPLTGNWREIVASRLAETNNDSTQKFGNNAKSNANSFLLMLSRHNGRWNEVSDLYKTNDPAVMRTQFWGLNHGPSGIKNKVQGFIGLTFGVKAAVLDRWRWVELHLPMAMKLAGKSRPKDYFEYTGVNKDTPEDPTGIYKNYGTAESSHPAYSTTLYTGLERATNAAINNYAPLRDYLGAHADAGGLHWHVWNAIKNESVGHSSLDLTKSYLQQYGRNMTPDSFHQHLMNSSAYVEGENKGQIVRLIMTNGEFKVERQ